MGHAQAVRGRYCVLPMRFNGSSATFACCADTSLPNIELLSKCCLYLRDFGRVGVSVGC